MFSSVVKNSIVRFALSAATLIFGAALEELLPKWLGAGFPVLLAFTVCAALRAPLAAAILYALAASAFEDSLSGFDLLGSASFFLGAAALARWTRLGWLTMLIAYPAYQLWLYLFGPGIEGSAFVRFLMSIPLGVATAFACGVLYVFMERRSAVA